LTEILDSNEQGSEETPDTGFGAATSQPEPILDPNSPQSVANAIMAEVAKAVVGQSDLILQMLAALFAGGHALLEGPPGSAKTLATRAVSKAINADFKRIQFTPDLMPSDITGLRIYDTATSEFLFRPGPVFTNILLADEINRTPPKTQAALLEAMQEAQVSADGDTYPLPPLFTVFATQNPIEFEGTYPLPEAQVDRFLLKIVVDYPSDEQEREVLKRIHAGFDPNNLDAAGIKPVVDVEKVQRTREAVREVAVEDSLFGYVTAIVNATRKHPYIALGGSPRASIALLETSKAIAAIKGRNYVIPDDIKQIARAALRHRLILKPEAQIEGVTVERVIDGILDRQEVPR
jgi:MoxR-like ATPase